MKYTHEKIQAGKHKAHKKHKTEAIKSKQKTNKIKMPKLSPMR